MTAQGMAYFAEPIDQAGPGNSEPAMIRRVLIDAGWIVYSPRTAWWMNEGAAPIQEVEAVNRWALNVSQLLVAYLPPGVPTVGVPREIEHAVRHKIPVIVVGQLARQRFALADVACVDGAQELEGLLASGRNMERLQHRTSPPYPDPRPVVQRWLAAQIEPDEVIVGPESEKEALRLFNANPIPDWTNSMPEGEHLIGYELRYMRWARPEMPMPDVAWWGSVEPRVFPGDAGFDLFASQWTRIPPNEYGRIPCGVAVSLPTGVFGWVVARSSTFRDKRLIVLPGVIDTGWRGELEAVVWNTSREPIEVLAGDRVAQLVLLPNIVQHTRLVQVQQLPPLPEGERGVNGFGSSNRAPIYDDRGTD